LRLKEAVGCRVKRMCKWFVCLFSGARSEPQRSTKEETQSAL